MKIAVICANGKAGSLIAKEAVDRGLDVTAVIRGENKSAAKQVLKKDMMELTAGDLKGFDVVIDAFGTWTEDTLPMHPRTFPNPSQPRRSALPPASSVQRRT